jgi:hypothetical protein
MLSKEQREEIINELKEQYPILDQCTFNEFNINDKLIENTKLYVQYKELYEHELFIYKQLEDKKDQLVGQRYDFYRFESDRNLGKTEIEQYYLPRDPKVKKDQLVGQRYDFYRFESDRNLGKTEIEQYYLPRDPKVKKMNQVLEKQKVKVDFFKLAMDSIEKLYWRMKEFLKSEG